MRFMEGISSTSSAAGTSTNSNPTPEVANLTLHTVDSRPSTSSLSTGADYDQVSPSDLTSSSSFPTSSPRMASQTAGLEPLDTSGTTSSTSGDKKARLIYCKNHVAVHPSNFSKDNVSGYLGIVEVDKEDPAGKTGQFGSGGSSTTQSGNTKKKRETLVTWVPDEVLERMDAGDREGYKRIETLSLLTGSEKQDREEDGFVFVSIPPPRGEKYAFSVPVDQIYSILVYPPSLSHWYGSATFNLAGGVSLPTLYFHDDESPLLSSSATIAAPHPTPSPRSQWGFPPFISLLSSRCNLLRSRLVTPKQNQGAELWLINPSKQDREVHEAGYEDTAPIRLQPQSSSPQLRPRTSTMNLDSGLRRSSVASSTGSIRSEARRPSVASGIFGVPDPVYPPDMQFPSSPLISTASESPKQSLLMGLSNITNFTRKVANRALDLPLAQPINVHLPPSMRTLINNEGIDTSIRRSSDFGPKSTGPTPSNSGNKRKGGKSGTGEIASEFESARLYLARWARVVAEEGERARKVELARKASFSREVEEDDLKSDLGVFSLLPNPNSKRPVPSPTRDPGNPITRRDWDSFAAQGRDELFVRKEIFRRGFSDSKERQEKQTRREGWEVLLGIIPWNVGGLGGGDAGKTRRQEEREKRRMEKRAEYDRLKDNWIKEAEGLENRASPLNQNTNGDNMENVQNESWKEEWHRIDVDCRRTDRNQEMFKVPDHIKARGDEEKEGGGAGSTSVAGTPVGSLRRKPSNLKHVRGPSWDGRGEEEEGGMAALNPHIAAMRTILMTYHTFSPELGYVQGMSDLLSPIYVVFDGNEADAFGGLVGVMKIMESNFLRDQSGMKRQLSVLQKLIGVMDPELYAHLEQTDSLNLFFCFRWILISFKREFAFNQVIRLWEVLWTNYYTDHFNLFVALAILQSHRDVLMRYLVEFDEVLKYANDLSGTIDLDTTLAQAEVVFLTFRDLVQEFDAELAAVKPASGKEEDPDQIGVGIRQRKPTASASKLPESSTAADKSSRSGEIVELRGLVKGWGEEVEEGDADLEYVLEVKRRVSKGFNGE